MGDEAKPTLKRDGLHVGDFVICPTAQTSTDDHLDTPENRERDRQTEEDDRAARHDGCAPPSYPSIEPTGEPVIPLGEGGDLDVSIQRARARVHGKDELPIPILLRDPLTGKPVGSV
jgi:hypothetical protein